MSFGRTWWGKRWLRTLEQLGLSYPNSRLAKARSLVGNDAVDLLHIEPGELSAWVDQPRRSFGVTISLPTFTDQQWRDNDRATAARLGNLAALHDDRLPPSIDNQLSQVEVRLFPGDGELTAACPCTDRRPPCVHVIAVQHAFTVRFDDDPYLLPLLRGRNRADYLAGVRAARPSLRSCAVNPGGLAIDSLPVQDFFTATTRPAWLDR
jgi:uncharacterized Zn finger protein